MQSDSDNFDKIDEIKYDGFDELSLQLHSILLFFNH